MPCPCDEQKKKGGGYWRKCEKKNGFGKAIKKVRDAGFS